MGNANVVARELGIPLDPLRSIDLASVGQSRSLDAIRANGRFSLAMVGVGYDGIVTRRMSGARGAQLASRWYRRHADSLYAAIGFAALFASRPRFQLEVDGESMPFPYRDIVICNIETYAKGWAIAPGADPGDGQLDYQARRQAAFLIGLWALAGASLRRRVPRFIAHYGRGARFRLRGERPFSWQADGDPMGLTRELEVEVLPAALRLVGPA
jgi:diacylglycerol kinase family enzyme